MTQMNQMTQKSNINLDEVVLRFSGDSGDGMQTVGEQFTDSSAIAGNDICTFPDFPAEIRAPQGTLPGVSGFQIHFGKRNILTPGDQPDGLVAMNPAALKVNLSDLKEKGLLILNTDSFTDDNLRKAGYSLNPLDDKELNQKYQVLKLNITTLTQEALKDAPLRHSDKVRSKNFFALGFCFWLYERPIEPTIKWIKHKWSHLPHIVDANIAVLKAGYYFGDTSLIIPNRYKVDRVQAESGLYRKITGNDAFVLGLVAAADRSDFDVVYGSYPITPASSILEGLSRYKNFPIKTLQVEDEIAAIGVTIGASFAGQLGVTGTSGPGVCLKSEAMGLAVITELPLIIINVQRGGPSTGLPTKTEQGDLLQAVYSRHGESPMPVLAAKSPSDCFDTVIESIRIAIDYSTPVMVLSDSYIANGAEPWKIPSVDDIPQFKFKLMKGLNEPTASRSKEDSEDKKDSDKKDGSEDSSSREEFKPYQRDPQTLGRTMAIPGTRGFEHRIGGLEKNERGDVSYDPENHELMVKLRDQKICKVAESYPPIEILGSKKGDVLVIGWGSTYGAITSAVNKLQEQQFSVSSVHLRYINPLPLELGSIIKSFKKVVVPELNLGQLSKIIQAKYLLNVIPINKIQAKPFSVSEIYDQLKEVLLKGEQSGTH